MKSSVIISTHNYGRYLAQCLESVFCQDPLPDEVIVVDDGSTDETPNIVTNYAKLHNNLIYIRQENKGKAEAFNKAILVATGDLIWHLDADDFWMPNKTKEVTVALMTTRAAGIMHDVFSVDENGVIISTLKRTRPRKAVFLSLQGVLNSCFSYCPLNVKKIPFGMPNTICVRKEAVKDLFPLPNTLGLAVDGALLLGASRYGIYYLPQKLSAYRYHGANYYLKNPHSIKYQIALFQWFQETLSEYRFSYEKRVVQILAKEAISIGACNTIISKTAGFVAAIQLIFLLVRSGLIPNWKHFALPLRCLAGR